MTLRSAIETAAQRQLSILKVGREAIPAPQALQAAVARLRRRFGGGLHAVVNPDRINRAVGKLKDMGVGALSGRERFVLAYNLAVPVGALAGRAITDVPPLLEALVQRWSREIEAGTLRGVVWRGLCRSWLQTPAGDSAARLRRVLLQGLPGVTARSRGHRVWLQAVHRHQSLFGDSPCRLYVAELLEGRRALLDELTAGFPPPAGSWFWEALVGAIAQQVGRLDDAAFRRRIPLLLGLGAIDGLVPRRDDLLALVLERCARCADQACDPMLRDYALEHWKNPQLRANLRWDLVSEGARQMVGSWLSFEDLEDFFRLCQDNGEPDTGRLQYWMRFRHQISFSQLVIGPALERSQDPAIVSLRERRPGRLARLTRATDDTNALIMRIGDWVFVVFSPQGGECYPYRLDSLPMEPGSPSYFIHELRNRRAVVASDARTFPHLREWQVDFDDTLRFWGIRPDVLRPGAGDSP